MEREEGCTRSNRDLAEEIRKKLEQVIRDSGTTAACAAVCAEGELLAGACAGKRGFEDSKAQVEDLYNIGSVSKVYTTVAVMKLVQEGKISLDTPVSVYLPDWKLGDERYREITVRMLLNHSSGIPGTNLHDHLVAGEERELFAGKYRNTPEYWRGVKLRARPGSFSCYSNDGFDLLVEVVEAVTGEPYIQWLREQIGKPAGLFSIGAGRRLAAGHVKVSCKGREPEYYNCFGAGAIHTTVPECALFGYLFVDAKGIVEQSFLDETRRPQGVSFLQGAYDATNFCLGWDSLYNRDRIPLGEGAVVKDGGTEQFSSYLLVSPARRLSLAISATDDGDVWWLDVLEDIGREALKALGEGVNQEAGTEAVQAETTAATESPESKEKRDPASLYSGLAYGSCAVYRFSVSGAVLNTEIWEKGGNWKRSEELSGFRWDGNCFAKGEYDKIFAEEYGGNVYYIRWGEAFCQRNSAYPVPGSVWPTLAGVCFQAEGEDNPFGTVCLEGINEENVLLFTTEHEEYPVVPLTCDPRRENETCLISETDREGIVFRLEKEGERTWLRTGTDKFCTGPCA